MPPTSLNPMFGVAGVGRLKPEGCTSALDQCCEVDAASAGASNWAKSAASELYKSNDATFEELRKRVQAMDSEVHAFQEATQNLMMKFLELRTSVQAEAEVALGLAPLQKAAPVSPPLVLGKVSNLDGPFPVAAHGDPHKPQLLAEGSPSLAAPSRPQVSAHELVPNGPGVDIVQSEGRKAAVNAPIESHQSGSDISALVESAVKMRANESIDGAVAGLGGKGVQENGQLPRFPSKGFLTMPKPSGPLLPPCLHVSASGTTSESFSNGSTIKHQKKSNESGTMLQLRDMWKELYLANELKADEHLEQLNNVMSERRRFEVKAASTLHTPVLHHHVCRVWDPISSGRIFWDVLGLCFVMADFIIIPYSIAWEAQMPMPLSVVVAAFWSFDFLFTFNTAYYAKDRIVKTRFRIAKHYLRGWFLFDTSLLALDWALIAGEGQLGFVHSARTARALRINRLFRVSRLSRLKQVADDFCISRGHEWVMPVLTVLGLMLGILLIVHFFGCAWFLIGMTTESVHEASWVTVNLIRGEKPFYQYIVSVYWILTFIASAPVSVVPVNSVEIVFTVVVQFISLLIIGGTVSQLASTISELNARYHERNRLHMSLRQYLVASAVPADLHQRILRFADHSLRVMASRPTEMEPKVAALLSQELRVDLVVVQFQQYLCLHPLLSLFQEGQEEVFRTVCGAIKMQAFEEAMKVFSSAQWAQCMYITTNGTFRLFRQQHGRLASLGVDSAQLAALAQPKSSVLNSHTHTTSLKSVTSIPLSVQAPALWDTFSQPHWFAEASLFANVVHQSTLLANTFADALTLSPSDLADCVSRSPICILCIHEYATAFLADVQTRGLDDELPVEVSEQAREVTQLHKSLKIRDVGKMYAGPQDPLQKIGQDGKVNSYDDQQSFLKRALAGDFVDGEQLADGLGQCFPELHPATGCYAVLGEEDERKRSIAAIVSILEILADRYGEFTEPQHKKGKMTEDLWRILRHLICSEHFQDTDVVHALVVLLAVRGLGKVKKFVQLSPVSVRRSPEGAVTYAVTHRGTMLPSVACLKPELAKLLPATLGIQEQFNFAQWLQGENTPSRIQVLNTFIQSEEGDLGLRFYLIYLVGIMCGIAGTRSTSGSAFMTEQNCWNVVFGIQTLTKFHELSPECIYWEFIVLRVHHVGLSPATDSQFAFSRLVCLNRAWTVEEIEKLSEAWDSLEPDDQSTLTQHMLADGIRDQALMLVFVPLYFVHARENPAVGLTLALTVMAELIAKLRAPGVLPEEEKTVRVDLRDLAAFTKDVRLQSNFAFCLEHAKFTQTEEDEVRVLMTAKNWQRMNDVTGPSDVLPELARDVKQVLRKQVRLQDSITSKMGAPPNAVHVEDDMDLVRI